MSTSSIIGDNIRQATKATAKTGIVTFKFAPCFGNVGFTALYAFTSLLYEKYFISEKMQISTAAIIVTTDNTDII